MNTVIISENNDFLLELIKDKKISNNINVKCIISAKDGIENIKKEVKIKDIFVYQDFKRGKIQGLKEYANNEIDYEIHKKFKDIEAESYKFLEFANPNNDKFSPRDLGQSFNNTLVFTLNFIEQYNPNLVFFTNVPHSFDTYILYKVCLKLNIKTIFKREISLPGLYMFQNKIKIIPEVSHYNILDNSICLRNKKIFSDYQDLIENDNKKSNAKIFSKFRNHELSKNSLYTKIPIIFYLKKTLQFIPQLFLRFIQMIYLFIVPSFFKKVFYLERFYTLGDFYLEDFSKEKNKSLKESRTSKLINDFDLFKAKIKKLKLLKEYKSVVSPVDLSKKFIYFPLHYQPEATTYPFGGMFADQIRALRLLSVSIPENYFIYVKEHPDTFNTSDAAWSRGDRGRDLNYYKDIQEISNVRCLDISFNSLDLINKCSHVATIAGAVGIESLFKNKKIIVFGYPWYCDFPNIINVNNNQEKLKNRDCFFDQKPTKIETISLIEKYCKILFKNEDLKKQEHKQIIVDLFLQSIKNK